MTALTRRQFTGGLCSCAGLALAGCVTDGTPVGPVAPGYRPEQTTDEAGLWQAMDRVEADVKRSRFLVRDADLNAYMHEIACRLGTAHCSDIRVYVIRSPYFNATMAPNGMMQVYTGLLLRARNEAQIAAVIGHELGHYLNRHSLQGLRNRRSVSDFTTFLSLGLGAAGSIVQLAAVASLFAYNRDQEREADDVGVDLMARAGYAPIEASKVWEQLIAERSADDREGRERSLFFATHPAEEERAETLRSKAGTLKTIGSELHSDRYRQRLRAIRTILFQDELRLREYARTLKLFEMLDAESPADAELSFFTGEVHRLRNEQGDASKALLAYEQALAAGDAPPETFRGIGTIRMRMGDRAAADAAFERYLTLKPHADDAAIIRSYMQGQT